MTRKTIRVRAGDGLRIPLPRSHVVDDVLQVLTPETSAEVLYDRYTRRRIKAGDFVALGEPGERVDQPPAAEQSEADERQTGEWVAPERPGLPGVEPMPEEAQPFEDERPEQTARHRRPLFGRKDGE